MQPGSPERSPAHAFRAPRTWLGPLAPGSPGHRLARPSRRTLAALGIALVIVVADGAWLLASASLVDEESPAARSPNAAASFEAANPWPGDHGEYVRAVVAWAPDDTWVLEDYETVYGFDGLAREWAPDAAGTVRWTPRVQFALPGEEPPATYQNPLKTLILDDETGRTIGVAATIPDGGNLSRGQFSVTRDVLRFLPDNLVIPPPCGIQNALQESLPDVDSPVDLFGGCTPPHASLGYLGGPFLMSAKGTFQGLDLVEYRSVMKASNGFPAAVAAFAAGIPFPIWMGTSRPDVPEIYDVVRLSTFQRGVGPGERAPRPSFSALDWRPVLPWGLDDEGIDHPFPASEAYRRALADPGYPIFRDYAEKHSSAWPLSASYSSFNASPDPLTGATTNARLNEHRWSFDLADSDARLLACYERLALDPPNDPGFASGGNYATVCGAERPTSANRERSSAMQFPTVASVVTMFHRFSRLPVFEEPTVGWGIEPSWHCSRWTNDRGFPDPGSTSPMYYASTQECHATDGAWVEISSANETMSSEGSSGVRESESGGMFVQFDDAGRTWSIQRWHGDSWRRTGFGTPLSPSPAHASLPPPQAWRGWDSGEALNVDRVPKHVIDPTAAAVGVGLLTLVLLVTLAAWSQLRTGAAGFFYARLAPSAVLKHPTRIKILEILRTEPGLHFRELQRRLGISNGLALHHLRLLLRTGHVQERATAGFTCYFAAGSVDRRLVPALAALRAPAARTLLAAVAKRPGQSFASLSGMLKISRKAVAYHAERLEVAGLIANAGRLREARLSGTDLGTLAIRAITLPPPGFGPAEALDEPPKGRRDPTP